jgi:zinc protease
VSVLDRTSPPASGAIRNFDFPTVERRTLSNGLDLRVARIPRLPVVSAHLFMRSGEGALHSDRSGLAVLTADAVDGGTRRRSGTQLAEALERIGARFGVDGGWEGTTATVYCHADRLAEALPLVAEAVTEPAFPEEEVARAKEQHLAGLRQRAMDPSSVASDAALGRYFADGVPYGRPRDGMEESIVPVGRETLRGYADANYRPEGGGLIVVGDVDGAEVEELAESCLGPWTGGPVSGADFEVAPASRERRVLLLHRPGSVQSEIRVGHVGTERLTPDYFALSVANMILGGTFTSRLNLNLRERHGFTYGVRSRFSLRTRPGPFEVSTAVGNEVTAPAVSEILSELSGMADGGPTDEEVVSARDYGAGIFGLQLETVSQIASRVSHLVVYGLPDGYYADYRDRMRVVSTREVAEAAARHVRPEEAQIVVVGDADVVGPPLQALGLGAFEVRREQPAS